MSIVEKTIKNISPSWALKRAKALQRMQRLNEAGKIIKTSKRGYDAASKSNRLSLWLSGDLSANEEVRAGIPILRQRSRDLVRNNSYAAQAINVFSSKVVGEGIKPQFSSTPKTVEKAFKDWAESTEIDSDGCFDVYGLQGLIIESVMESGEVFVRRRLRRSSDKLTVPLQIQILEPDFLDHYKNEQFKDGRKIIQGIEFDALGKRVAYWMFKEHPGEKRSIHGYESVRVPASQILHIYRKQRPGQERGIPVLTPVMIALKELDTFIDASLKKQQVAACFSAFIYTNGELDDDPEEEDELDIEKLGAGDVHELGPGKDIKFTSPPSATDFDPFTKAQLKSIAAGLGIAYSSLTGDLKDFNFSSGRIGLIQETKNIRKLQKRVMITQFLNPLFSWFLESIELSRGINTSASKCFWTPPAKEMIDPQKEGNALRDQVKSGLITLSEAIRSQGRDPDQVYTERSEELKKLDELGIKTDSDPRSSGGANAAKENPGKSGESEDSDEDADGDVQS